MRTIWKYQLEIENEQTIQMPFSAEILCVQPQAGVICLWAIVNEMEEQEGQTFYIYGTGHICNSLRETYIGTCQIGEYVYHVFKKIEEL